MTPWIRQMHADLRDAMDAEATMERRDGGLPASPSERAQIVSMLDNDSLLVKRLRERAWAFRREYEYANRDRTMERETDLLCDVLDAHNERPAE